MTRQYFVDEVCTWSELFDVVNDYDLYEFVEDIVSDDGRNDEINECLVDWAREYSWNELLDTLRSLDNDGESDWWVRSDYGEWYTTEDGDDTFEEKKADILQELDDREVWEDADEESEEIEAEDIELEPEEEFEIEDGEAVDALFVECSTAFKSIVKRSEEEKEAADKEFAEFFEFL